MLFHSIFDSWWVVEKCFPVSLCLMWDQIFSLGFKSGLWPGQNMSLMDLFSIHVLVVFAVWAGVLSWWKITSDCSTLENKFSIVGGTPFCNILLYSKALIWNTVKQLTSTSSWKGSPQHGTSPSMLNCGRDAFTIVFLNRSLNTPLWRSAWNWNLESSLHTTLNNSESNFPYSAKNLILSDVFLRQQLLFNTYSRHYLN